MKKAFTLVELLVVISVVSMLASIVMVRISLAQASGRDAVRVQEVHQIDLATKLYVDSYKKTPALFVSGCDVISANPTAAQASACLAVSTAAVGTDQEKNWNAFKVALNEFIKVPDDPCAGTCASSSAFPIGYTYVAPLAVQYYCSISGTGCVATNDSYQIYAPMERQTVPVGSEGSTDKYFAYTPSSPSLGTINIVTRLNGRVLTSPETGACISIIYFEGFPAGDTAGCVRSWSKPFGTRVDNVIWVGGYPVGANTSITPTILPSYPQTLDNPPAGVNPLIYYIDFI